MNPVESLAACAGRWAGTSTLHDPHTGRPYESPSKLAVTPVVGGRFVRLDYDWVYQGRPQEGSLLVGFDKDAPSAYWIDTWHMGRAALICTGTADGERFTVRGTYPAPPGPDWGWRIDLTPAAGILRVAMFNVFPAELGGKEDPAVEATYLPAA
jgi:hypothetical protein